MLLHFLRIELTLCIIGFKGKINNFIPIIIQQVIKASSATLHRIMLDMDDGEGC